MEIVGATIVALQRAILTREVSCVEAVEAYLRRAELLDKNGPSLNSLIEVNQTAVATAHALDVELSRIGPRGPLHGIPIVIKDNIDTQGLVTSAGSVALAANRVSMDAEIIARLRAAGAIVIGKANMSEWAYFRSTRGVSGWSSRGGQVRNPYSLDRSAGGSSSGSAVAVAASLAPAAIGTETNGSIVCPSSLNGVVGIKPTHGLLSAKGIVPISESQDTAGPLTRNVQDAAVLLSIMANGDRRSFGRNYAESLEGYRLLGARLGVLPAHLGSHEGVDALVFSALEVLEKSGAVIVDGIHLSPDSEVIESEKTVLLHEFKDGLNRYLAAHPNAGIRDLEALIEYNATNAEQVMPYFGQELLELAQETEGLTSQSYQGARRACALYAEQKIQRTFENWNLDAIIAPTCSPAWTIDLLNGDNIRQLCSREAAIAGNPHVTLPVGQVWGMPVGLSIIGRRNQEDKILAYAYMLERVLEGIPLPSL